MDLKKIKSMLFEDIELVLGNLGMTYEIIGDNVYSTCPVHEGSDNNRAFSLSLDKQIWRCWTRDCQQHFDNDIFGLIRGVLSMEADREVGFKEALLWSCKILNINSKDVKVNKVQVEEPSDFVKMVDIFSELDDQPDEPSSVDSCSSVIHPSEYFSDRGYKDETLLHFEVGDCIDKSSPMVYRAVIPIHNDDGSKIIAQIGRTTKDYRKPKFLFTKGFDKRNFLYNYHRAIEIGKQKSCLFITEGQGDVWKLFEAGVVNAVSIFGKSLSTQQQIKLERSGVTTLVVLTDNDQAGRESKTEIQRRLGRLFSLRFPRLTRKDVGAMSIEDIETKILNQVKGTF